MRTVLWSKFWGGVLPILVMAEGLTLASNEFLGVAPFLKVLCGIAVLFVTFGLVGLAAGMGARFPRFTAENVTQIAGSYGGIAFMIFAVLFVLVEIALLAWPSSVLLWHQFRGVPLRTIQRVFVAASLTSAAGLAVLVCWLPMRRGVLALERLGDA
jgi:hypothetical protein